MTNKCAQKGAVLLNGIFQPIYFKVLKKKITEPIALEPVQPSIFLT